MSWNDDRWRDGYDAWKLATPPEYDAPDDDEGDDEDFADALDDFIEGYRRDIGSVSTSLLVVVLENKIRELQKGESK